MMQGFIEAKAKNKAIALALNLAREGKIQNVETDRAVIVFADEGKSKRKRKREQVLEASRA